MQGPTFLVEYHNTQNDGNHIHSVWRDFHGDFGRDLLREHLRSVAHYGLSRSCTAVTKDTQDTKTTEERTSVSLVVSPNPE